MDIEKIRRDTLHCEDRLFVNSAGSSLPPAIVNETIIRYLKEEERLGGYELMIEKHRAIEEFYSISAQLINAHSHNIAFASSATDAYGKALSSIPFEKKDVILTTDNDYISNHIQFNSLRERFGVEIKRIQNLDNGDLDIEHMKSLIFARRPALIAITHIPTNSGLIQDALSVGEICREFDILYLLDACQSVGQLVVDVQEIGCDFLSMTGRKFMRGPRGTGFLYVADNLLEAGYSPLVMDSFGCNWKRSREFELNPCAKRFELWEKSEALKLGLKEAIRYALDIGMENIETYNTSIRQHLLSELGGMVGVELLDLGSSKANIITLRKEGISKERFTQGLDGAEVVYSISSKESALIDFEKKEVDWAIRLSPHYFNTRREMDRLLEIIHSIN